VENWKILTQDPGSGPLSKSVSELNIYNTKESRVSSIINLTHLNSYIPYEHFKLESLALLKEILQPEDL